MTCSDACILQFAKAPRAGKVKTRLIPALGEDGALQLHKRLLRHTWESINTIGLADVQLWTDAADSTGFFEDLRPPVMKPSLQQGADLGERMRAAIAQTLQHYSQVVVIGSDCPVLDAHYLNEAFMALQQGNDVVLGPASDGGYVLIGMRMVYPELFESIPWGSDQVLKQTRQRLKALDCRWHELPERWDVDRPEDLLKLEKLTSRWGASE